MKKGANTLYKWEATHRGRAMTAGTKDGFYPTTGKPDSTATNTATAV